MAAAEVGCPRCGAALPRDARYCAACGYAKTRLTPGQVLDGKYEILDKLAEGGMGEVYRARHVHLDEIRVIKVTKPDPHGESPEPRRFQEEARLATRVRHPNVATLYDFSRLPDGSYYMVSEFIDGVTLEERLRARGALPPERALEIARQVLAGLAEIHAQGIVHRDLSPDNIMLRELPDGRVHAKIIDLGVAKRIAAESLRMTGTGMFVGKLKYCSPEQAGALPRGETVDARSDLYSFGIVLYEMLAGRPPFESESPEGYLGQHLHATPPPLETRTLPPGMGAELARVVERALEKSRQKRFQTAEEFRSALERAAAAAKPPPAASTTGSGSAETLRARKGIPVVGGAAAILLLVAAAATVAIVHRTKRPSVAAPASLPSRATGSDAGSPPEVPPDGPSTPPGAFGNAAADRPGLGRTVEDPVESGGGGAPAGDSIARPAPHGKPAARPLGDAPSASSTEAARLRNALAEWTGLPLERRARRASELAAVADAFVRAHPDDPLSAELREKLPGTLASLARRCLDDAKPFLAVLYRRAYRRLSFAPADPELERRIVER